MTLRAHATASIVTLATTLLPISLLAAQELVQVTGQDRPLDADFEEVFRVGVIEGESWEMFGRVHKVAFDARGNLHVFDGGGGFLDMSLRVLVFDRSGGFVREFGSAGQGPGEFAWATGYAVTRDGTTIVGDRGHRAYQIFDEAGGFLRMVRPPDGSGGDLFSGAILSDPRGVAVFAGDFGTSDGLGGGSGPPPSSRPVMRLGLGDDVAETDTIVHAWLPPRGEPGEGLPEDIQVEGRNVDLSSAYGNRAMPSVFEPPLLVAIVPDGGIVYSDSSAYALKVTSPASGEIVRVVTRPFRPAPVTPSVIEEFEKGPEAARLRALRAGMAAGTASRVTGSDEVGSASDVPDFSYYTELSVLCDLAATWEGRIWVGRCGDAPRSAGPIDVMTAEGNYIGTFQMGAPTMPDAFGPDGLAAFIELDEFDVASVVVRRLPAALR